LKLKGFVWRLVIELCLVLILMTFNVWSYVLVTEELNCVEISEIELCLVCFLWCSDGPAEDLYGIFINRARRERPPEYLEKIKG